MGEWEARKWGNGKYIEDCRDRKIGENVKTRVNEENRN